MICAVQINTEERYQLLLQSLTTLINNNKLSLINRLIIVDDCSNIKFIDRLTSKKFLKPNTVVFVRNDSILGVGGSKNAGVDVAKTIGNGKFLYFFDGDVFFTENALGKILTVYGMCSHEFLILGGGIHPFLQPRAGESFRLENIEVTSHDAVSGWSWLLTYETWDKYGRLADNAIGSGKSEDWEYCQRIRNDGFKVGCLQPQVIGHCGLTNTEGLPIVGYDESLALVKSVAPEALII